MCNQAVCRFRRGFVQRTASALLLYALSGLLLIIPSVSSEMDGVALGNVPLYSDWREENSLDDGFDEDIAGESADFSVGSFSLHRPQSELFMKGLLGKVYNIAAAAAVEGSDIENYLQARTRAQIMNTAVPDFKRWLSSRNEGITDRIFINSADYLTDYLTATVVDNAEGLNFVRTIEWDYQTALGNRRWQTGISALGALRESNDDAVVWQLRGYAAEDSGTGANAGLIYRRAVDFGGNALVGANVFLDYEKHGDYDENFLRWSVGGEYRNAYVDIYLNRYFPISDAVLRDGDYVYTQGGQEAYINLKAPDFGVGEVSGGLTYYRWEGEYGNADDKGFRYHIRYSPRWSDWRFELELDSPDGGDVDWGGQINYHHIIGSAETGYGAISVETAFDARAHFFDAVRREYAQRIRNSNDEQNRTVVARVLDDSTGKARLAILDSPFLPVTLSVVNGVGERHTLTLSTRTISITVEAATALELSASNWLATIYEEGVDRLADTGGRLDIISSTTAFERFSDGLNTLLLKDARVGEDITVALLLDTKGDAGHHATSARYDVFTRLVTGNIALTVLARNRMSVELFGFAATAIVDLPPAFFALEDTEATVQLTLACSTDEQRDAHRVFQEDYAGCVGDVRISGLENGERLSLHTQGRNLTLVGTTGINGEVSIAVVDATGFTLTSTWDSYPFHPHNATLEVFNDAVSIFHGRESGELAALGVAANSKVAFVFADAAAGATATTAVSIYAAVFAGAVSDIGAGGVVDCVGNSAPLSEGLVSVMAACGGVSFSPGGEMDIIGRVGLEHVREVEMAGGGGMYDFELVGEDSNLTLLSPTGAVAMLMVSPDKALYDSLANSPADSAEYRLRASPLPPFDVFAADAQMDIHLHVLEGFAVSHAPATDDVVRTEIDENVLLYRISHEGSTNDEVSISICLCPPPHPLHHSLLDHFAVGAGDGKLSITNAIPPAEIAEGTVPALSDPPQVVGLPVGATDKHSDDESLNATVSVILPVTVRHPSGDVTGTYNYASVERNGNYAVYNRAAVGGEVFNVSDTRNAPDSGGVSVSGISIGGHYNYRVVNTLPSGFALVTADAPGTAAALRVDSASPPALGRYEIELAVDDDHSLTAPFLVTASVEIITTLPLLALTDPGPIKLPPDSDGHSAGDELFVLVASGGDGGVNGVNYRYALSDTDEGKVRFAADPDGTNLVTVEISDLSGVNLTDDDADSLRAMVELSDGGMSTPTSRVVNIELLAPLRAVATPTEVVRSAPHTGDEELFRVQGFGGDGSYNYRIVPGNGAELIAMTEVSGEGVFSLSRAVAEAADLDLRIEVTDGSGSRAVEVPVRVRLLAPLALAVPDGVVQSGVPHTAGKVLFEVRASGGDDSENGAKYEYTFSGTDAGRVQVIGSGAEVGIALLSDESLTNGEATRLEFAVVLNDRTSPAVSEGVTVDLQPFDVLALTDPGLVVLPSDSDGHSAGDALFMLDASGGDGGVNGANYRYVLSDTDEGKVRFAADPDGTNLVTVEISDLSGVNLTDDDADSLRAMVELSDGGMSTPTSRVVNIELLAPLRAVATPTEVVRSAPHTGGEELFRVQGFGGDGSYNYRIVPGNGAELIAMAEVSGEGVFSLSRAVAEAADLDLRIEVTDGSGSRAVEVPVRVRLLAPLALAVPDDVVQSGVPHTAGKVLFEVRASGGDDSENGAKYEYTFSGTDAGRVQVIGSGAEVGIALLSDESLTNGEATRLEFAVVLNDRTSPAVSEGVTVDLQPFDVLALTDPGLVVLPSDSDGHSAGDALFMLDASGGDDRNNGEKYTYVLSGADADAGRARFTGNPDGGAEVAVEIGNLSSLDLTDGVADRLQVEVILNDGGMSAPAPRVVDIDLLAPLSLDAPAVVVQSGVPHGAGKVLFAVTASGGNGGANGANYAYTFSGRDSGKVQAVGSGGTVEIALVNDESLVNGAVKRLQFSVVLGDGGLSTPVTVGATVDLQPFDVLALTDPGLVKLPADSDGHSAGDALFMLDASGGDGGNNGEKYTYVLSGADADAERARFTGNPDGGAEVAVEIGNLSDVNLADTVADRLRVEVILNDGGMSAPASRVVDIDLLAPLAVVAIPTEVVKSAPHNEGDPLFRLETSGGDGTYNYRIVLGDDDEVIRVAKEEEAGVFSLNKAVTEEMNLQLHIEVTDNSGSIAAEIVFPVHLLAPLVVSVPEQTVEPWSADAEKELLRVQVQGGLPPYRYDLVPADVPVVNEPATEIVGVGELAATGIVRLLQVVEIATNFDLRIRVTDYNNGMTLVTVPVGLLAPLALDAPSAAVPSAYPHNVGKDLFILTASGGHGGVDGVNYNYPLSGAPKDPVVNGVVIDFPDGTDADNVQVAGIGATVTVRLSDLDGVDAEEVADRLELVVELRDGLSTPVSVSVTVDLLLELELPTPEDLLKPPPHNAGEELFRLAARGGLPPYRYEVVSGDDNNHLGEIDDANGIIGIVRLAKEETRHTVLDLRFRVTDANDTAADSGEVRVELLPPPLIVNGEIARQFIHKNYTTGGFGKPPDGFITGGSGDYTYALVEAGSDNTGFDNTDNFRIDGDNGELTLAVAQTELVTATLKISVTDSPHALPTSYPLPMEIIDSEIVFTPASAEELKVGYADSGELRVIEALWQPPRDFGPGRFTYRLDAANPTTPVLDELSIEEDGSLMLSEAVDASGGSVVIARIEAVEEYDNVFGVPPGVLELRVVLHDQVAFTDAPAAGERIEVARLVPPDDDAGVVVYDFLAGAHPPRGGTGKYEYRIVDESGVELADAGGLVAFDTSRGVNTNGRLTLLSAITPPQDLLLTVELQDKEAALGGSATVMMRISWRAANEGRLYALGGIDGSDNTFREVWASDDGESWALISTPEAGAAQAARPLPDRRNYAAAALGGTLYISGGRNGDDRFNDVWASGDNGVNWSQVATAVGLPRESHAMISYKNNLYIIGGLDRVETQSLGNIGVYHNDVWRSQDGKSWQRRAGMDSAFGDDAGRYAFSSVEHNGRVYFIGGRRNGNTRTDEVFSALGNDLVPRRGFTLQTGTRPSARSHAQALSFYGTIYLLGGQLNSDVADIWSWDNSGGWIPGSTAPAFGDLSRHIAYVRGDSMYVAGGRLDNNGSRVNNSIYKSSDGADWQRVNGASVFGPRSNMALIVQTKQPAMVSDSPVLLEVEAIPPMVEKPAPHRVNEELFRLRTSGGSGTYDYRIASGNRGGIIKSEKDGQVGVFRLKDDVLSEEVLQLQVVVQVTDGGSGAAEITVPVRLLLPEHILVIGGDDGSGAGNEVWRSLGGQKWRLLTTPDVPEADRFPPRYSHAAVVVGGETYGTVYISGGTDGTSDGDGVSHFNDVWSSIDGVRWQQRTTQTSRRFLARSGHEMVAYEGTLFVIGGTDGDINADGGFASALDDIWYSTDEGVNWQQLNSVAAGACSNRALPLSFVYDEHIIVAGGYKAAADGDGFALAADVRAFDGESCGGSFGDLPVAAVSVYGGGAQKHAGVVLDGDMYIAGAANVFSSASGSQWKAKTAAAAFGDLNNHAAVVHEDRILVIGGRKDSALSGQVWSSANGESWAEEEAPLTGELPPRMRHAAVVLGPQSSLPLPPSAPPLALTGPTEVVKPKATHSLGRELFAVTASGGAGGYVYSIASVTPTGHIGIDSASGVASITATVAVSTRIEINTRVTDADNDTADFEVTVDLLRPLAVTGPTDVVYSTAPHTEGRELFEVEVRGGTESYTYGIGAVTPAPLAGNFGIGDGSKPISPPVAGGVVTLVVTLAATVATASRATVTITVSDGDQTALLDVTVQLSAALNHMLVIGGDRGNVFHSRVWLSFDGERWERLPLARQQRDNFEGRGGHAAAVLGGTLYISGGYTGGGSTGFRDLADVWASTDGVHWKKQSDGADEGDPNNGFFPARINHQMFAYRGTLFIMGGRVLAGRRPLSDIWFSVDEGKNWKRLENDISACRLGSNPVAFVYEDRVILAGGVLRGGGFVREVRSFDGKNCSRWGDLPEGAVNAFNRNRSAFSKVRGVLSSGDMYLMGASGVWSSPDGRNWTEKTAQAEFSSAAAFTGTGGSGDVLVGHQAVVNGTIIFVLGGARESQLAPTVDNIWSSADGSVWTIRAGAAKGTPSFTRQRGHAVVALGPQSLEKLPRAPLGLTGPTAVVHSTAPHTKGRDLFAVTVRGGAANGYTYSIKGVDPALLAGHFGIGGAIPVAPETAGEAVVLAVTLAATVDTASRAVLTVEVSDGEDTAQIGVTVELSAVIDHILVIGGETGGARRGQGIADNEVWWSADGERWTNLPAPLSGEVFQARRDHAGVAVSGTVYISGGRGEERDQYGRNALYSDVWASTDGIHWQLRTRTAPPRYDHQMVAYDNTLFIIGGQPYSRDENIWHSSDWGETWQLTGDSSVCNSSWESLVFVYDSYMLIAGGKLLRGDTNLEKGTNNFIPEVRLFDGKQCGGSVGTVPPGMIDDLGRAESFDTASDWAGVLFDDNTALHMYISGRSAVWSSANGARWTRRKGNANFSSEAAFGGRAGALKAHAMVAHNEKLFIVGGHWEGRVRTGNVWSSSNGKEWEIKTGLGAATQDFARRSQHVAVVLGTPQSQSFAPPPSAPLVLAGPAAALESELPHLADEKLFTVVAYGSGGYRYGIESISPTGYIDMDETSGVVSITATAAVFTRIVMTATVTDADQDTASVIVTVDLLSPLVVTGPTQKVRSTAPHTEGRDLFAVTVSGGKGPENYSYAVSVVTPPGEAAPSPLADNFGFTVIRGGAAAVTLMFTLAATVAEPAEATLKIAVNDGDSDGDQTAEILVTVALSAVIDHMPVIGGETANGETDEVWWPADGERWTLLPAPVSAEPIFVTRSDHAAVAVSGTVYISGGGSDGVNYLNDVWVSTDGIHWQ